MARFSTFSGRKNAKGGVKPQVAKIEAASRGHKSCHNGHPCHPSAITVALAIRKLRPSPLPSGRNSHPPCRCDDANARTKKQQELSERGYFAIPAPSISDGELLQGEAPPCHSANALHRSFETQQGNRATKRLKGRIYATDQPLVWPCAQDASAHEPMSIFGTTAQPAFRLHSSRWPCRWTRSRTTAWSRRRRRTGRGSPCPPCRAPGCSGPP